MQILVNNLTELAKIIVNQRTHKKGVSKAYVTKLRRQGKIVFRGKKIDVEATINQSGILVDYGNGYSAKLPEKPKSEIEVSKEVEVIDPPKQRYREPKELYSQEEESLPGNVTPKDLMIAELAIKKEKIITERRKNEIEAGKLIEKILVDNEFFEIARFTRDAIENIPSRISSKLVGRTAFEIEQLLITEIKKALNIIVNKLETKA